MKGPIGFMGYKMQLAEQFKYLQNKIADQLEGKKIIQQPYLEDNNLAKPE